MVERVGSLILSLKTVALSSNARPDFKDKVIRMAVRTLSILVGVNHDQIDEWQTLPAIYSSHQRLSSRILLGTNLRYHSLLVDLNK